MKTRLLFFASLLALTGCGSSMSDITPGDEVEKASFENAFLVRNILLHSNYHVDITYKQYNHLKADYCKKKLEFHCQDQVH